MNLKNYVEAMNNLPARFSNLTFWRDCRKLKDSVVNALEYLNDWGIGIENKLADKLPKSPSYWEAWTAEEQAEARSRMGLGEKIIESGLLHPEDNAQNFYFNFDEYIPDGYIVSRIVILYEAPSGVNAKGSANVTLNNITGAVGYIGSHSFTTSDNRFALLDIYDGMDGYVFCDCASGNGNRTSGNPCSREYNNIGSISNAVSLCINFKFAPKADNNIRIRIVLRQFKEE